MDLEKELNFVKELENLEMHVQKLDIPHMNKEKILKVIEFEKDFLKRGLMIELGKNEYEKIKGGK
jgi:hypothetical protein